MPFGTLSFFIHIFHLSLLFEKNEKKKPFCFASSNKSRTFAVLLRKEVLKAVENRDVVQLVVYLVWDQGVARSSRVIPTNKGRLAQLVQSVCLTSRGSAVRIRQRPLYKTIGKSPCRLFLFVESNVKNVKNMACSTPLIVLVPHKIRIFAPRIE